MAYGQNAHSCDPLSYYSSGFPLIIGVYAGQHIFFSFAQEHSSSAFTTLSLRLVEEKRTMDTTSPLLTSNTLLQSWTWCIIFNIIKERKIIKMYPSECGRALKYVTCKGKKWCSIIPKRDAEKRQLLQRPNPNILPTILPKAPIILCRSDNMYNRKGRLKSQGIFPNKSHPQPTHNTRKTTNPTQIPPSPTQHLNKHAPSYTHTPPPSHTSQFKTT